MSWLQTVYLTALGIVGGTAGLAYWISGTWGWALAGGVLGGILCIALGSWVLSQMSM